MTKHQKDSLTFLFSRMTWPSLMVRERACTAITELLIDDEQTSETMEFLKHWAVSQELESLSVFSLLILLRAKMLCSKFELPSFDKTLEMIKKPSALSYLLLKELGYQIVPKPDWSKICLEENPKDFVPSNFFKKYCKTYLPPIYETHSSEIERKYSIPFYQHWAFEWKEILANIGKKPSAKELDFWGRPEYEHYEGVDFLLSEVYRSAYLKTLAWLVVQNVPEELVTFLAIETCPIDPSLWRVRPQLKPHWWPTPTPSSGVIDTVVGGIWEKLINLRQENINNKNDFFIAQSFGRVCESDTIYDLEIRGFFQKCYGNKKPNLENILKETTFIIPYITGSIGLDGYIGNEPISKYAKGFDDWELLPVTCKIWPYTTPRWQFNRLARGIWIPAPFLAKKAFAIKCEAESLNILEGKDVIGEWRDWRWNLKEKINANLTPSNGEYLLLNRSAIDDFVEEERCSFCWICKITQFHREHSYTEYNTYVFTQEYGASNIIQ